MNNAPTPADVKRNDEERRRIYEEQEKSMSGSISMTEINAEIAWDTYKESVGGKAFNGDPLPTWQEVCEKNPRIANAWRDVAKALQR